MPDGKHKQDKQRKNSRMMNMLAQSTKLPRLTKTKGFILAAIIVGVLALPFLISAPQAQAQNEHCEHSQDPFGSWVVDGTLDPLTVPPGTPLNFMALFTFSEGGGFVQSNTGPGARSSRAGELGANQR
jgi:hypothetical protein